MRASINTNQKKRHAFQRAISVLLLLLCFFDLAVADIFLPGSCERESAMLPVSEATDTTAQLFSNSPGITNAKQEKSQTPTKSSSVEDDCFCCCTHIVPVAFYKVASPSFQLQPIISYPRSISSAPHTKMFRPPRIA